MGHQIETLRGLIEEDVRKPTLTWFRRNHKWINTVLFWLSMILASYGVLWGVKR
jgi:hypothetical protein